MSACMIRSAAYCRVSTSTDEQLDSLESQQRFFSDYAEKNGMELVKIYADEGKSGTKMKNRTELLRLLQDAAFRRFDVVLIKDVSRLARNTVDFLTSIRKLKELGVKVIFVNYDQTSSESSEFMLTMLSAIAQEESANTSKRVKFGKRVNAEKGRVPNFVYGYDKTPGDYFNLSVNQTEAETVKEIFDMYTVKGYGAAKIASALNGRGIKTKRGCKWSQNAVSRILSNRIYIGEVVNGKQEVCDFLTGRRESRDEESWLITYRPELKIVDEAAFYEAGRIAGSRSGAFKATGERVSERHVFSKLIKCACCGASFRRQARPKKIKWVCAGRSANGAASCPNRTVIGEEELLSSIREYFYGILADKPGAAKTIAEEFTRKYRASDESGASEKRLGARLEKAKRRKQRYVEMYEMDVISAEELKEHSGELNAEIGRLSGELALLRKSMSENGAMEAVLNEAFTDMDTLLRAEIITNDMLRRVIETITADQSGNIDIRLRLFDGQKTFC